MNQYAFVLGHYPEFSALEIFVVLKNAKIKFNVVECAREILLITTDQVIDQDVLPSKLGGTIKLIQILGVISTDKVAENLTEKFRDKNFVDKLTGNIEKVHFGISFYQLNSTVNSYDYFNKNCLKLMKQIKLNLNSLNIKSGFLLPKEPVLSSVSVTKNKLITKGFELIIIFNKNNCLIGKTMAVQPFEDFSFRDFGRPERDSLSGMIPPKLARMMLNIAGLNDKTNYLDPFCGSGTFIQEAILLDCQNITASDISPKAVSDTKQNIQWLQEKYPLRDLNLEISLRDVAELHRQNLNIDLIATEPYLGSPNSKLFTNNQLQKEINMLQELYLNAFKSFAKILKPKGKVIIVLPVFKQKNNYLSLNVLKQITNSGFRQIYLTSQEFIGRKLDFFNTSPRGTLLYGRDNQTVLREIAFFEKI